MNTYQAFLLRKTINDRSQYLLREAEQDPEFFKINNRYSHEKEVDFLLELRMLVDEMEEME